ncbi:ferredoxin reductase [Spongisporangium articulatum]|uniref:Ferredoxin reductase n=1 Tax=Spongisporangium articulatum TaxID=3362603 RepID=A0ABW8AMQ9_9ACTN
MKASTTGGTRAWLTPAEVSRRAVAGLAQALTYPADPDRYLELGTSLNLLHEGRAVVTRVRPQTADTTTLSLKTNRAWRGHRAGQYVRVAVEIDGVLRSRCFSPVLSEHARGRRLELTVRHRPDGVVSPVLTHPGAVGTVVHLSRAEGEFVLPDPRPLRLTMISAGCGITPVMSMLRTLHDEGHVGEVAFLHYARDAEHVPYAGELARLAAAWPRLRLVIVHTGPGATSRLRGHFQLDHLLAAAPWWADAPTYLCGPRGLREAVERAYQAEDLGDLLHVERYRLEGEGLQVRDAVAGGTLTFTRSGVARPNDGRPLLAQAEAAGLHPESGCRMGICHGCLQVKHTGVVRNVLTDEIGTEPDQEVQACVCVPVGDVTVDL